jgi:hypothetical protein
MDGTATLSISSEKVCYIIAKARQFEAKVADPDSGSNPVDDGMVSVLEDQADESGLRRAYGIHRHARRG